MGKDESKKILYISSRADFGGGPLHVNDLINHFKREYCIYCASPLDQPYGLKWKLELKPNHHFEIPHRKFSIKYLYKLLRFINGNKIQLIHAHGKGAGIYTRILKIFKPSVIVIFSFHGFHPDNYNGLIKFLYILYERLSSLLTNYYINVSYSENKTCLSYNIFKTNKATVIYNGVKKAALIHNNKIDARIALSLPLNQFIIVSANRFDVQKNLILVLKIAKLLKQKKQILFLLLGDGEQFEQIRLLAKTDNLSNVFFAGYKPNVQEYLESADLYLATSKGEALGYSLIEACRAGLPIIATNVSGHNEMVIDGYNGFLFDFDNDVAACSIIQKLLNEPDELKMMGQNGQLYFEKHFVLNMTLDSISFIYSKFLK